MTNHEKPSVADMLRENRRRISLYFRQYDADKGDEMCEVVAREKVAVDGQIFYLPCEMLEHYPEIADGNLQRLQADAGAERAERVQPPKGKQKPKSQLTMPNGRALTALDRIRLKYDFEFWCLMCVRIQDKLSKQMIPFRLNYGQRKTAHSLEQQRLDGVPMRLIIVKARQWGGSTVTQMYMLWIQLYHYRRWHSAIVSQLKNQAINIRSMLSNVILNYPPQVQTLTLTGFEGLGNTKFMPQRECKLQISSAETPDALRSFDFAMLHLSEVGLWKSTPARSAEDLMQALYATVPNTRGTLIVMESTAKGIGNFFHQQFIAAQSGDSMLKPVFVAWFEIENYALFRHADGGQRIARTDGGLPVSALADAETLISQMTDYQWTQWRQGATLEGIAWYAQTQKAMQYTDYMMRSEYPGTAAEAFQCKSNRYYEDAQIEQCRLTCRNPQFIGNIRGNADGGQESLSGLHLVPEHTPADQLKIWTMPESASSSKRTSNRFVVVTDIGGIGPKSDWSVISVLDRAQLAEHGGALRRAATWRGHIDHDQLAWKAAQLASFYNNALLVIESNTLETKDRKLMLTYEGNHFYTVIDEIADFYDNMYMRESPPDVAGGQPTRRYGWHTNVRTKYLAYDQSRATLRDGEYVELDQAVVDEMAWLERKPNGTIGAMDGQHDDLIDTTAIGIYVSTREMPLPAVYKPHSHTGRRMPLRGNVCNF